MSLFQQAAAATAEKATVKKAAKKSTTWLVGSSEKDLKIAKSVAELCQLNAKKKAIDAKMAVHKTAVLGHARSSFFSTYAENGVFPETPMLVQNEDGQKVTFVVQDRSSQYAVKPEQLLALSQLLGGDAANELVAQEVTFAFQRSAMMNPEVQSVIEKHLEAAINELAEAGKIDGIEDVLDVEQKTAFKPGTLQRLSIICGNDTTKMRQVVDAMGSAAVQYIKC